MSPSDADDDDDQLKSLRAVWRAMPDEDPPTRGLDALLTAARAQAQVFATPPWWKRVFHALARPPVLALVTVMILIGGAVLISKRDEIREAGPSLPSQPATRAPAMTPATPPQAAGHETDKLDEHLDTANRPASTTPAVDNRPDDATKKTIAQPARKPASEPARRAATASPPMAPRPSDTAAGLARPSGDAEVHDDAENDALAGHTRGPVSKSTASDGTPSKQPTPSTARSVPQNQELVDQLWAQCRSAATHGDCEAAKMIARRIAARSSTYYQDHVASDAAVQKCIAPIAQ